MKGKLRQRSRIHLKSPLSRDQQAEAMDGQFFHTGSQVPMSGIGSVFAAATHVPGS